MGKKIALVSAGLILNLAAGFYNMGASVHDKTALMLSCLIYLFWVIVLSIWIVDCRTVTITSACKTGLALAVCYVNGILLSQSFIGLLFIWPFMGIAYYFMAQFDLWMTVLLLYLIPVILLFGAALWNQRKHGNGRS